MIKKLIIPVAAFGMLAMTSCSSKLGNLTAENFNAVPQPMETQGGYVPVTINGNFAEKYMKKNAVVTITPELRASNGSVLRGVPTAFQGEKVMGNDQTISYLLGGHYVIKADFPYTDTYHKSDLYVNVEARQGKKTYSLPSVKIDNGVIATSELYRIAMAEKGGCIAPDSFQRVRKERQVANIKFLINQAKLRQSEMKNNSVQEFLKMLKTINNEREAYALKDVEVRAYASPDGAAVLNTDLAFQRQMASENYVREQLRKMKMDTTVGGEFTAEDWEGFQQLVAASNIQDKDVILRVLSMYQDPEEREQQIRNMSMGFRELADGILPELRRSRLIINYESVGRSDEQIQEQYRADAKQLSADELLYAATLDGVNSEKAEAIYKKATELYPDDYRAYNNIAVEKLKKGDLRNAQQYLDKALSVNASAPETMANLALMALKNGSLTKAQDYIAQAGDANDYSYALGTYNIAKGNYKSAMENLKGQYNNMNALAQILNKDYEGARVTFKQIGKNGDGVTDYLHAIMSARQGNSYAANTYLKDAISKDGSLARYAESDLEFAKINK